MYDDLEIPAFLRRTGNETAAPIKVRAPRRRSPSKQEKIRVHLSGELPRIGCGVRYVSVDKVGRKWVTILYGGKRYRVAKKVWEGLLK